MQTAKINLQEAAETLRKGSPSVFYGNQIEGCNSSQYETRITEDEHALVVKGLTIELAFRELQISRLHEQSKVEQRRLNNQIKEVWAVNETLRFLGEQFTKELGELRKAKKKR